MAEDRSRKNKITTSFSIKDIPLRVYKRFIEDIDDYNDCYWAKLMDLIRKADGYDMIVASMYSGQPVVQEKQEEGIRTMGGLIKDE